MASNILTIGKSALAAAQIGISTTGHNIANASTPGYNRQVITQSAAQAQSFGYGYVGQGTNVASVTRVFNELLHAQMVSSQSNSAATDAYYSQIKDIDNLLSDSKAGLNPALSSFFDSVKAASANASDIPTRQTMLSNAQALVNRLNVMGDRLSQMQSDVNTQISGHVSTVNAYATQLARLNDTIEKSISVQGNPPNDLMDQRDQLVVELSKMVKTTVVPQGQGSNNIFIGNGLPLVVGKEKFSLVTTTSPTDSSRTEVGYSSNGNVTILGSQTLAGGEIGGLLEFRAETLDSTQNQLGQIALVLAEKFNSIHKAGYGLDGSTGQSLFSIPTLESQVRTTYDDGHTPGGGTLNVSVSDASALLSSDYKLAYDGTNFVITRLADGTSTSTTTFPITVDGLTFSGITGSIVSGDEYAIRPTRNIASSISLAFSDVNKLALAENDPTDTSNNDNGPSDNGNALDLVALQLDTILKPSPTGSKVSLSSAFAQLVSKVGNKSNELKIIGESEAQLLKSTTAAMQSESGVNLDEEAADLIRYQQAYQAAGKMMQIASELFNVLLQLNN
jgi:flagellar hook-associated protein 1 FlgK